MLLREAIAAAGMTPPKEFRLGRFVRFPGCGKGRGNSAGWCKLITPTCAVYGDWSTGLSEVWTDESHQDSAESKRLLREAQQAARERARADAKRAQEVERQAARMLSAAKYDTHPYLARKGFKHTLGLVHEGKLLVPIRAVEDYSRIISMQLISENGEKRFLPGGRVKGGIHKLGGGSRIALCEGFATGLSVEASLKNLPGHWTVVVCFSADNLALVATQFPDAIVCADHDESGVGERVARKTGLKWAMPPTIGDFNDLHCAYGALGKVHVAEILREVCA